MKMPALAIVAASLALLCAAESFGQATGAVKRASEITNALTKPKPEAKYRSLNGGKESKTRQFKVAAPVEISTQAILFKFGTTEIEGEESFEQLKELGKALSDPRLKDAVLEIQGHTDNVGSAEYNQKLSEDRAEAIVQELRRHYDLSVKQLIPIGKGKSEPVAGSLERQTDAERALNRRVVIKRVDE